MITTHMCVCVCVCMCVCIHMCVCVFEGERERETATFFFFFFYFSFQNNLRLPKDRHSRNLPSLLLLLIILLQGSHSLTRRYQCRYCYQLEPWQYACNESTSCSLLKPRSYYPALPFYTAVCKAHGSQYCLGRSLLAFFSNLHPFCGDDLVGFFYVMTL